MKNNLNLSCQKNSDESVQANRTVLFLAISFFLFIGISNGHAQQAGTKNEKLIEGIIRDADDASPLEGVNVTIKGTYTGILTKKDGSFSLRVDLSKHDVLVFSFLGKETLEYSLSENGSDAIDLSLKTDTRFIGEVVVYGAPGDDVIYHEEQKDLAKRSAKRRKKF